jgi:opacity protein-like surface antigen
MTAPISVGYRLDRLTSFFLRGILPLGNDVGLYGLVGITEIKGTHRFSDEPGPTLSSQRTTTGTSFGGGIEARLLDNLHLTLEYISYVDEEDLEMTAFMGGLRWSF